MSVNTKKLCQQIKRDAKQTLLWTRDEQGYHITNRHYMVTFKELPRDVLSTLLGVYLREPEMGQTLKIIYGDYQNNYTYIDHSNIPKSDTAEAEGKITAYMRKYEDRLERVVMVGDRFTLIQEDYAALADGGKVQGFHAENSPVFLANGMIVVLPIRVEQELLQGELLKITTHFEYSIQ